MILTRELGESLPRAPVRRRRFDAAWKRALVEKALLPGASVAKLARDHDVNTNQLFKWCRQHERSVRGNRVDAPMMPVVIEERVTHDERVPRDAICVTVQLARGTMRLEGSIDGALLGELVKAMSAR